MSSAYHPQTGQSERTVRTLQQMLRFYVQEDPTSWEEHLPDVNSAYNTAAHRITGFSPAFLLYGVQPRTPLEALLPNQDNPSLEHYLCRMLHSRQRAFELLERARTTIAAQVDKQRKELRVQPGDWVLLDTSHIQFCDATQSACPSPTATISSASMLG